MPRRDSNPPFPASERPQTHALDRAGTADSIFVQKGKVPSAELIKFRPRKDVHMGVEV